MVITGATKVLGVIGWPVAHSGSPAMHNAAIAAAGVDAVYVAFPVAPEGLGDAVRGLRALGIQGVNVTLPHKETIFTELDDVHPDARAIGAVNTVIRDGERWIGQNTDAPGLARSIEEAGVEVRGRRVTVLGAGGAARAAAVGLARAGAERIAIAARRAERAQALAGELQPTLKGMPLHASGFDDELEPMLRDTDLLVQATSATLDGGEQAEAFAQRIPVHALPSGAAVVDLVYRPRQTTVLRDAAAHGLKTVDGLGMLLHQGAIAFERWLGHEAPLETMRAALEGR